jgi:hypothetical protein
MQAGGVVLLHNKTPLRAFRDLGRRLGRLLEVAFPFVFLEGHRVLSRLLKKSEKQIPRGLKPPRNDNNKGRRTAHLKVRPFKHQDDALEVAPLQNMSNPTFSAVC